MKRNFKLIAFILSTIFALFIMQNLSFASSDFELKSMNFDANLNEDGSMNVTETWNIDVRSETNTLFKTFKVDSNKYKEIKDVKVSQIEGNEEITFNLKNKEVLHVDKNCYYGLINKNGDFEIAWGINEDYGKKTYKVSYTVVDAIKNYKDCSELYWQFIGKDFQIDIDRVTGTINIPTAVVDKEEIRAWAHGPLNGNISIEDSGNVKFEIDYLDSGNFLEVRMAMPTSIFSTNQNIIETERLNTILSEEQTWANEANALRERMRQKREKEEKLYEMAGIITSVVMILISLLFAKKIFKYKKVLEETPSLKPTQNLDYYRDIPNEKTATPAKAAFLHYFENNKSEKAISRTMSATMLNLSLNGYLSFEEKSKKIGKDEIVVHVNESTKPLEKDEEEIYNLMKKIDKNNEGFTMKQLKSYAKKEYTTFLNSIDEMQKKAEIENENEKNFDSNMKKQKEKWGGKTAGYIFGIIAFIVIGLIASANVIAMVVLCFVCLICASFTKKISNRFNGLTQKGMDEKEQWKGLKNFLKDYSQINDKTVPEVVLWEKYLVYATMFGIADEVLKQIKVAYPDLNDDDFTNTAFLGMMYSNSLGDNFIRGLESGTSAAYAGGVSAKASYDYSNSSSGGGFGGGFSGGGGFGGGGRRPEEVDKTL